MNVGAVGRGRRRADGMFGQRLVAAAIDRLTQDPTLGVAELGRMLGIARTSLGRTFKLLMGVTLAEYRNRLRLDRFEALLAGGATTLMDAAMGAGFGSYAQFHRVIRAQTQVSPREHARRLADRRSRPAASPEPSINGK